MNRRILSVLLTIVMVVGMLPGFAMTASAAETPNTYTVTVENGTGSGSYAVGETVTITANTADNKIFTMWYCNEVEFADRSAQTTTFIMPEMDVTVRAVYEDVVTEEHFTITGSEAGWTYVDGVLTFTQSGAYTVSLASGITATDHVIVVDAEQVTLTLNNVTINAPAGTSGQNSSTEAAAVPASRVI